jgi:Na+-transporting NADH:ubiquinone oxidoreductase subunit C
MHNESTKKILTVALGVCLVCAVLVSTTAVTLKPIQKRNAELDKIKNILAAGGLLEEGMDAHSIQAAYAEKIRAEVIDLAAGQGVPEDELEAVLKPSNFDIKAIAKDTRYTTPLESKDDPAQIKKLPKYMVVYKVMENDVVRKLILPVYGKGLWSTMYGLVALDNDLTTVRGFTFYEHGETPGLGGEVDNPRWKSQWEGKQVFDASGLLKIEVIKGLVTPSDPMKQYRIDGLSGSTLTTRGVNNLVRFWLGEMGYGRYLNRLRGESPVRSPQS